MCPPDDSSDSGSGARRHQRYDVDWRVNLTCKDWHMAGKVAAANASRGGLFLFTPRPPPVGTQVQLSIALPDGTSLNLSATVQHVVTAEQAAQTGRGAGIGVKFDDKHEVDLLLLEQMATSSTAERTPSPDDLPEPSTGPPAGAPPTPQVRPGATDKASPPRAKLSELKEIVRMREPEESRLPLADPLEPSQAGEPPPPPEDIDLDDSGGGGLREAAEDEAGDDEVDRETLKPAGPPPRAGSAPPVIAEEPPGGAAGALGRVRIDKASRATLPKGKSICPALGIDYGTSFTSAAVTIDGQVYLVPDTSGRLLHPSVVSYPEKAPQALAWEARERIAFDPRHTVASAKRLLGQKFTDPSIAGYLQSLPYKTIAGPGDTVLIEIGKNPYAVPQVAAQMIGYVRDLAEKAVGQRFNQVALSCPVTYTEEQKVALRRSAQLAGLEVVAVVAEPVAGALAYGIGQDRNEIVAVYDFGGGTFDFSLLDMAGDHVRLIASEGDAWLGGDDFDFAVSQAVADAFWRATKIELRNRAVEWQRLLMACEQAKRDLSGLDTTTIVVEELIDTPKRIDLRQRLDRALFERLTKSLFDRSLEVCNAALGRAGLEPTDVTQIVMTGGVSRIPYVRQGLSRYFERDVEVVVNPDEAIALGAGMRAAQALEFPVRGFARR